MLGIGYDNDIRNAQSLALGIISDQPAVLSDPAPQVLIDNLGSATVNLSIYFWVNSEQHSAVKVSSQLMRELIVGFTDHGVSMPDDARERILLNSKGKDLYPLSEIIQSTPKDNGNKTPSAKLQAKTYHRQDHLDDVSSDADEIREQADESRDPEQGDNII